MEEIKLGDIVVLKEALDYDHEWMVTFIEGSKVYCYKEEDKFGIANLVVDISLLKKSRKSLS